MDKEIGQSMITLLASVVPRLPCSRRVRKDQWGVAAPSNVSVKRMRAEVVAEDGRERERYIDR